MVTIRACSAERRAEAWSGVADQQVGQDRGQFPEDEHQEQVIGRHQAEHGAREGEQLGAKSAEVVVLVLEVPGAVDQDQRAHAEDQQGHDPGQGVHPEGELNLQLGDPRQDFGHAGCSAAGGVGIDRAVLEEQPDERTGGHRGEGEKRIPAEFPKEKRRHSSHRKVHGKDCDHWYLRNVRNSIVKKLEQAGHSLGSVRTVYQAWTNSFRTVFSHGAPGSAPAADNIRAMNSAAAPEATHPASELESGARPPTRAASSPGRPGTGARRPSTRS